MKTVRIISVILLIALIAAAGLFMNPASDQESAKASVLKPFGHIAVSIKTDNGWEEAGRTGFRQMMRNASLDLTPYAGQESITMRFEKVGGGAAHIDMINLGASVPGFSTRELEKVLKHDNDVTDITQGSIEVTFAQPEDMTLKFRARIEPEEISKQPFQMPTANLWREVDRNSLFYTYTPGSTKGSLEIDGEFSGEKLEQPFQVTFTPCGSGHPDGRIYTWVMDDGAYLYAAMDFTPDNTMDGDLDYASVHIKTGDTVTEYKVSVQDTEWGLPGFTYTDKVGYQHKVYEFKIPMSELIAEESKDLELAFSAYGTAAPAPVGSGFCFNPVNGRFIKVFRAYDGIDSSEVYTAVFDQDGGLIGTVNQITNAATDSELPVVASNNAGGFLLLYIYDMYGANPVITGQFLDGDGLASGDSFPVSSDTTAFKQNLTIAHDTKRNQWLIVWDDNRGSNYRVQGSLLDSSGTAGIESELTGFNNDYQFRPVYNAESDMYNLVFGNSGSIYFKEISPTGIPGIAITTITTTAPDNQSAACDPLTGTVLIGNVFWTGTEYDILASMFEADGTVIFKDQVLDIGLGNTNYPSIGIDVSSGRFAVVYGNGVNGNLSLVSTDGIIDPVQLLDIITENHARAEVAGNPLASNFGVSYLNPSGTPRMIVTAQGTPLPATGGGGGSDSDSGGCLPGAGNLPVLFLLAGALWLLLKSDAFTNR